MRVTVNESARATASGEVEGMRVKVDQSLQSEECDTGLAQSLHCAARLFELANTEQSSSSKISWFSTAWSGIDKQNCSYQALESVEEALKRLEGLLQELHVSSSSSGQEHLKAAFQGHLSKSGVTAATSSSQWIRRLNKEAEFLEASFRAKEASLKQGGDVSDSSFTRNERQHSRGKDKSASINGDTIGVSIPRELWSFLFHQPTKSSCFGLSMADGKEDIHMNDGTFWQGNEAISTPSVKLFRNMGFHVNHLETIFSSVREQSSSSKISWFSTAWIGIDKIAWIKELYPIRNANICPVVVESCVCLELDLGFWFERKQGLGPIAPIIIRHITLISSMVNSHSFSINLDFVAKASGFVPHFNYYSGDYRASLKLKTRTSVLVGLLNLR
ncbi:hypothetical protein ACH5RR_005647 [Cinchona calisaya]|uniref:Uncharacterized protein n=1 Tax=Cinchona calisaya TaxID=153742 RepID=A0ABD3ALR8_9GENT